MKKYNLMSIEAYQYFFIFVLWHSCKYLHGEMAAELNSRFEVGKRFVAACPIRSNTVVIGTL